MKTIKCKFVGWGQNISPKDTNAYWLLSKHYNIELVDDPDYIIISSFCTPYEYCKYPQVRVFFSGENYIPDLNIIDYSICNYPLTLGDRNYWLPGCVDVWGESLALSKKTREYPDDFLKSKEYFANFIYSHESEYGVRGDFMKELSKYKRVESPGTYLNNMDNNIAVKFWDGSKVAFQRKCKFSLCFESTSHDGFNTEKLTQGFVSDTIPIYYGDPHITEIFNPKAFVNCLDYPDFQSAIDYIKLLDQNDDLYMDMIRQPVFNDPLFPEKILNGLNEYLIHIFDQPVDQAYRRSRVYYAKSHDDFLAKSAKRYERSFHNIKQQVSYRVKGILQKRREGSR